MSDLNELDPDSPEYEAAIEAAQAAEDAAIGNEELPPEDEAPTEAGTPAAEVAAEAESQTPPAPEKPANPSGVLSKDGKTVLPFAVVQSARADRAAERQARVAAEAERDALRQQLADIADGKNSEVDEMSAMDARIAEAAADFPVIDDLHRLNKDLRKELDALKGSRQPEKGGGNEPPPVDPVMEAIQEAIDSVPVLAEWQAADPAKFARARTLDKALEDSPKWQGKSLAARFAHVARQVADEFGIAVDEAPQNTPSPNKANPKDVIANAARTAPSTLSDFKGGAQDQTDPRVDKMPPQRAMAAMSKMSDAEIEAYLAKFG